ncbi:MAG: ABC transporter permease [Sphingomonadales bacterium 35-56-22]|jgi:iron complex transport system permease protein|uniref:FecCD family ABC transporter permease n=1 Tax=Sphingorhabdus sp. TaxID=1902408 RepID=UPI000BD612FE|nr:iron ABC transporter permease [Sphingorhabdus sp.]OYY16774.1 MAG: ABC transporter permease [Sphingomonadales bacterium 35-56-22]OYY98933.1 MAG: ABC transporter permease [Sphingomonadales bacterium 28-56-43]OYZ60403.1 MAG: ABC transporter permease [Sphingomonadales bacterium 24-56-14]OZA83286.1 MAG: ABC transporter permease [Sphingomonadales bacterium 39-57-19]HQS12192.1 iron ABC transporter permease [Sphingorhabdus sp.]
MTSRFMTGLLLCLTLAAFLLSLMAGKVWIWPMSWAADNADGWIFLELRLPRALLGLCVGAALGLSGAVLQGYLRNPLADPTVLGVSASAALGGVLAIFLGINLVPFGLFGCAMIGAGASILLLLAIGRGGGPIGFILGGMVLSTLAGALTAFVISIAPNPFAASEIINWLMGALTDRLMEDVLTALPFMAIGALLLLTTGRALDALTLGENGAKSLGVDLFRLQWLIVLGVGLSVGASVAVSGVVGFVGLIVPHLIRSFYGEQPSRILVPSALGGAILTLTADSLVRLIPGPGEMRLGIAMAVLGAPFFLLLLLRYRRGPA